jgi:hypothetical protein
MPSSRSQESAALVRRGRFLWETLWTAGDNIGCAGYFPMAPNRCEDAGLLLCGEPARNFIRSDQAR